jgi:hypothetical protein
VYRSKPCSVCNGAGESACRRCGDDVCAGHAGSTWCVVCEAERREEIETAVLEAELTKTKGPYGEGAGVDVGVLLGLILDAFARPFRKRRARAAGQAAFVAMSAGEIQSARARKAARG